MDLSIVIPNWNGRELLADCLESLRRTRGDLEIETIVVDNASNDDSVEFLRRHFPEVRLRVNRSNDGFARACNQGVEMGSAAYVLLLNSDTILQAGAIQSLLELARAHPEAAVVGAQLRNADGTFQSSYSPFPDLRVECMIVTGLGRVLYGAPYPCPRHAEAERGPQRVDWVGGACILVRRDAWAAMRGLDEGYFMYSEEMDLCYRLHAAGWQVWYEPAAVVVHLGGGSSAKLGARSEAMLYRSRVRFYSLHHGPLRARLVRWLILCTTAIKIAVHSLLRGLSGGRRGRAVVSLRQLRAELRGVG